MNARWPAWGTRTYVMGIVNCTPDSFSGDGTLDPDEAIAHGMHLVEEGADVLDVGGVSTRPGASAVAEDEELKRVLPVIERLAATAGVPISVDTSSAAVAQAALAAGAGIVNDVWALQRDKRLASVAAARKALVVLMHNRPAVPVYGPLGGHYAPVSGQCGASKEWGRKSVDGGGAESIVETVGAALEQRVGDALAAGIRREHLLIDPGIGFGKSYEENVALLRRLAALKARPGLAGLPLLVGTSRKSVVGLTLDLPVQERLEGTLATLALAVAHGADMVRVHDVRAAVRCCRMADAIVRGGGAG